MNSSLEVLKLQDTIFTELSDEPIAAMFELGWKDIEIIGDLQSLSLVEIVQQFVYTLKNPKAKVLQDAPNPNFFVLGAHLTQRIDSLMSILTNIFCQLLFPALLYIKTLLSWLPLIILSSFAQSISDTGWDWSCIYCKSYQESKLAISLTLKTKSLRFFLVAKQQNYPDWENDRAVNRFSYTNLELDFFCCIK